MDGVLVIENESEISHFLLQQCVTLLMLVLIETVKFILIIIIMLSFSENIVPASRACSQKMDVSQYWYDICYFVLISFSHCHNNAMSMVHVCVACVCAQACMIACELCTAIAKIKIDIDR